MIYYFIFIIIFIIILLYNNLEKFSETLVYLEKVITKNDVSLLKDLKIDKTLKTKQLCLGNTCITKSDLEFIKLLPIITDEKICIGKTCINKDNLEYTSKLHSFKKIKKITLKVKSSGLTIGKLWGISAFYIDNYKYELDRWSQIKRGYNILVLKDDFNIYNFQNFDTHGDPNSVGKLIDFIISIPTGYHVMVSIADEATGTDSPSIILYQHYFGRGWSKTYKINSDGSDTKIPSDWMVRSGRDKHNNPFPNDSVSSITVTKGIKAYVYQHSYGDGREDIYYEGKHIIRQNDHASSIIIKKDDKYKDIPITPYEAFKLIGSSGKLKPNYRGSYAIIGVKGMNPDEATEKIINSNSSYTNNRLISISKEYDVTYQAMLDIKQLGKDYSPKSRSNYWIKKSTPDVSDDNISPNTPILKQSSNNIANNKWVQEWQQRWISD